MGMRRSQRCAAMLALALALASWPAHAQSEGAEVAVSQVPEGLRSARRHLYDPEVNVLTTRSVAEVFETRAVPAGSMRWALPEAFRPLDFTYHYAGREWPAADFATGTHATGLIIIKDGRVVHEYYGGKARRQSHFQSSSLSKSVASMVLGLALADGKIRSLSDPVERYVPELGQTAYSGVSIRDLIDMRSGIDWNDNFYAEGPAKQIQQMSIIDNQVRFTEAAKWVKRAHPAGAIFHYNSLDSAILGLVLIRATGEPLASYMSRRLWQPAGMEDDASWMLDGPEPVGQEFTGGGFNARLRDYARLGLIMLNGGRARGRQVLPRAWVEASLSGHRPAGEGAYSYGHYWWSIPASGAFLGRGGGGQYIYINPAARTVIVKTSAMPARAAVTRYGADDGSPIALENETMAFFDAVARWVPDR